MVMCSKHKLLDWVHQEVKFLVFKIRHSLIILKTVNILHHGNTIYAKNWVVSIGLLIRYLFIWKHYRLSLQLCTMVLEWYFICVFHSISSNPTVTHGVMGPLAKRTLDVMNMEMNSYLPLHYDLMSDSDFDSCPCKTQNPQAVSLLRFMMNIHLVPVHETEIRKIFDVINLEYLCSTVYYALLTSPMCCSWR